MPASGSDTWLSSERCLELPSGTTVYVEAGTGPPLLLLHGLLGYSFMWRKNIPALAERFRVLALDFAGCGKSGCTLAGPHGVKAWSIQVLEFLDYLGIGQTDLVASSAGGAVAIQFAACWPEKVRRMVLAAPVNPFSRRVVRLAALYRASGLFLPALRLVVKKAPRWAPWMFRNRYYGDAGRLTAETVPGYLEGLRLEESSRMLQDAIRCWRPAAMAAQIQAIQAPILLIWGSSDKIIPPSCTPELEAAFPDARTLVIPGAGHFPYEETPEAFNNAVLEFLR